MPLELIDYKFDGPFLTTAPVRTEPGVFAVLGDNEDGNFKILDIGETENLRADLEDKEKVSSWKSCGLSRIAVAVYYTPEAGRPEREEISAKLIVAYKPLCAKE